MLRKFLIYLSQSQRIKRWVTGWRLTRRVATRFVAGDTLAEAVEAIRELNERGMLATLDHLGENVATVEDAARGIDDYLRSIEAIHQNDLKAGISLKLTQLGLEASYPACLENLVRITRAAAEHGIFVRIDMEHSGIVDQTVQIYRDARAKGLLNLGVVLQSYLYRSREDTRSLLANNTPIRLVKGAYDEPPEIAFPDKEDVDSEFDVLAKMMIERACESGSTTVSADGRIPPLAALGTHDDERIRIARSHAEAVGLPREALEFQLLFGIRIELGRELHAAGYPVRVYVPYGTEWYSYFMRRLAERPANLWFFLSNLVRG
ncbi:MAG: proline dehydrogenase family protein [Anaerolineales bacterium]